MDRHGARALTGFALACGVSTWALVAASLAAAPTVALVALSALVGLVAPPLGPFTRAAYGRMLRDRQDLLQRSFGLDSAGEEASVIFAPLLAALFAGVFSPEASLAIAAGGAAGGHGRDGACGARARSPGDRQRRGGSPLPPGLWLLYGGLAAIAASLGAIDISLPAAARESGHFSAAGVLFAVMATGTVAGSLIAGRRAWRSAPEWRVVVLMGLMGAGDRPRRDLDVTARAARRRVAGSRSHPRRAVRDRLPARGPPGAPRLGHPHLRVDGHGQQRRDSRSGLPERVRWSRDPAPRRGSGSERRARLRARFRQCAAAVMSARELKRAPAPEVR